MLRLIARLLLLVALFAAPLGMATAPAAAAHHGSSAAMPMQHCPDQDPQQDAEKGIPECAMACAAALPALVAPAVAASKILGEEPSARLAGSLSSLHPETATPPPKIV